MKKLEMSFRNELNRLAKYTIDDPKEDLTESEVKAVMDSMISNDIFSTTGGALATVAKAEIVSTEITPIFEA